MNSSLECIYGTHSFYYYYGEEHLLLNLIVYIFAGAKNNEKICISVQEHLYEKLLKEIHRYDAFKGQVCFEQIKNLMLPHKEGGCHGLRNKIVDYIDGALKEGYTGIRWICQPTYAIEETSMTEFLDWEEDLTEAIMGTKFSLICIYDFFDYINNRTVIDDNLIAHSQKNHSHRLYKFDYVEI